LFLAWTGLVYGLEMEVEDRHKAEVRHAESEAQFRAAFEQSPVGLCRINPKGMLLEANARFADTLGYAANEMRGMHLGAVSLPEDREASETRFRHLVEGHVPGYALERKFVRKDGTVVLGRITVTRVVRATGEVESALVALEDLTVRRQMEEEHGRLQAQLLQSQKLECVGRLAGGVVHDINNMATAVLAHAQLMEAKLPGDSPLLVHVRGIEQAAERSGGILRQLLIFSREEASNPEIVDLNVHLAETRRVLEPLIGEHVRMKVVTGPDLWPILLDPHQLDQVVMNLCVNARDAMPGGGALTLETSNVRITPGYCTLNAFAVPGPHVLLTVTDEGTGMDRETLARIFDPFFTTKESGKGTGLGLSTVMGIVRNAGGFVDVYSEPGLGTTFKVYLPAASPGTAAAPEKEGPTPASAVIGGRILLVEDDELLRDVILSLLEDLGFEVAVAPTPLAALALCADTGHDLDLLLTDMVMPEMNGVELFQAIRAQRPGLRVVLMSGYGPEALARHGELAASLPFIRKPFTRESLAAELSGAFNRLPAGI
jgi:PAS domain S-box-containing protein